MKKYAIITAIFVFSFLLSSYMIDNVFLGQSPKVNPFYLANLERQVKGTVDTIASAFKRKTATEAEADHYASVKPQEIPTALFAPMTKGVSAYQHENGDLSVKIDDEVKNVTVKQIEVNGKTIEFIDLTGEE